MGVVTVRPSFCPSVLISLPNFRLISIKVCRVIREVLELFIYRFSSSTLSLYFQQNSEDLLLLHPPPISSCFSFSSVQKISRFRVQKSGIWKKGKNWLFKISIASVTSHSSFFLVLISEYFFAICGKRRWLWFLNKIFNIFLKFQFQKFLHLQSTT